MTRDEAIEHVWGLSDQVSREFCVGSDEEDELRAETAAALLALGVRPPRSAPENTDPTPS